MTNQTPSNDDKIDESPSHNEVLVRAFATRDHDHVRTLFVEGMRIHKAPESYIERSLKTDLANINETYMTDRGTFLVMERASDGMIVGTVGLEDLGDGFCELRRMSIHASQRRKGYGKVLVDHFIAHARQQKFHGIQLSTGSWMESAMKFYTSLGFEDKGRVTYQVGESCGVVIANFEMTF